jgi:N utilization substance protein A
MNKIIDMHEIRYLNLFERVTRIRANHCFEYNNTLIFVVQKNDVNRAIGRDAQNLRKLSTILAKKVKVASKFNDETEFKKFIAFIIYPTEFNDLEINENEVIITAGSQNKAALLGRNKRRLHELQKITKSYLKKDLKVV